MPIRRLHEETIEYVFIIMLIYYSSYHSSCGCVSWKYLPLNE